MRVPGRLRLAAFAASRRVRVARLRLAVRRGGRYLFVSGPGGDARRYRCDHQAEQLRLAGSTADVGYHDELEPRLVRRYECVVLYRVPWDDRVARLLEEARTSGTCVIADVDDLAFDARHARLVSGISVEDTFERTGRTLAHVDGIVVSTDPLRQALAGRSERVAVAHNAVSTAMVDAARRARRRRRAIARRDGDVVVAYLSGTPTHDRDFLEAADAVLEALRRFPRLRFWSVGFLTLDERFDAFGERVVRLPYRSWKRLPALLARVDVNLAPLERGSEFTDAKSCLKYLEAALVAVPTIATPTSDFRRAIEHGVNGLLAEDEAAWNEALGALVASAEVRRSLGEAACVDVLRHHTTRARSAATAAAFARARGSEDGLSAGATNPALSD